MQTKQTWNEPQLTVFGDVEALTQVNNKNYGVGDTFTFQNSSTKLSG